jgi:hypothetical protein
MRIKDIVKLTNTYLAGEQLVYTKLLPFYDAVIDEINNRLNSTYPSFSSLNIYDLDADTAVYDYFPDNYIRSVVALGAAHKFYEMDEEGIVYDTSYEQDYERNLFYMTRDHIDHVPVMYQSDSTGGVLIHLDEDVDYAYPVCPCILRGL